VRLLGQRSNRMALLATRCVVPVSSVVVRSRTVGRIALRPSAPGVALRLRAQVRGTGWMLGGRACSHRGGWGV
jgi:hypothetical protein